MASTPLLYIFTALLAALLIYFIFFRRKTRRANSDTASNRCNKIRQILPIATDTGWRLSGVENGIRLWERSEDDGSIFGSSIILPTSLKALMDMHTNPTKCLEWDPSVEAVSIISVSNEKDVSTSSTSSGDVVSITEVASCKMCETLSSLFGQRNTKLHSRTWHHEEDTQFWLHSAIVDACKSDPIYTLLLAFPLKDQSQCEATLICDVDSQSSFKPGSLTTKLAGLKEHVTRCQYDVKYPMMKEDESALIVDDDEENEEQPDSVDASSRLPEQDKGYENTSEAFVDVTGVYLRSDVQSRYKTIVDKGIKVTMEYNNAKDGENGWGFVANIKNVEVFKKAAKHGVSDWDCSRGICEVNVPIHYLIAYCNDFEHNSEYDDMFEKGHVIEHLGDLTTVVYLEYKAIWPVSGRDFCALNATRVLADDLYVMVARSIKHPSCPQTKKYVRGKILMGAFVMKVISENPPKILLSYITHVDLQGSVPARIVNKVTANQPLSVGIIKKKAEKMYHDELANPNNGSQYSENVKITLEKLERARNVFHSSAAATPVVVDKETAAAAPMIEVPRSSSDQAMAQPVEMPAVLQPPSTVATVNGDIFHPATQENSLSPISHSASFPQFHPTYAEHSPFINIKSEYKTIGNQASAGLLQEVFEVAEVDITKPISSSPSAYEQWEYRGTEKEVMVFRKIHANERMHSFIGKGIIPCSPSVVWEVLQEPKQRHNYDNMLKETRILEAISDVVMVEYLHFETANCFQKQSRDFVVLRTHRKEKDKYLLSAISIDYPNSPKKKDVSRGKVLASGWVVEPLLHNGQLYSMVTYLSQVNPGGSYPVTLINLVGRKQPMCVLYLRKYIESRK